MKRIGDVFENKSSSSSYDLSDMRFLNSGVDTIKQLYDCSPKPDVLEKLSTHFDVMKTDLMSIGGYDWKFSKGGSKVGYQYILKNLELGFTVLLKSFYCDADEFGPHLKIEVSPESIDRYGLKGLSKHLRSVGSKFADTLIASGVAVHMCVDIKNLNLPEDFEKRLVTRAKRQFRASGISSASYSAGGAAFIYGNNETYTFGSASGLQLCVYDKVNEIQQNGKVDFVQQQWERTPSAENPSENEYKEGDEVHRIEFRFSHKIIKEFENGNLLETGELICIKEAKDLTRHLRGLWEYALNNFRLQHSTTYIHPIWQRLKEDVEWYDVHPDFYYKRAVKVTQTGTSKRNVAMFMGNYLKLGALRGLSAKHVTNHIMKSGLDNDLAQYFGLLSFGCEVELEMMVFDFVEKKLLSHRLDGVGDNKSIIEVPF